MRTMLERDGKQGAMTSDALLVNAYTQQLHGLNRLLKGLLIYQTIKTELILVCTGSHGELFG